jgi:hypothetical protein
LTDYKPEPKKVRLEILRGQLELERSSFIPHWQDIGNHVRPRRPRFNNTDVNSGERRNLKIVDGTGTRASRTLRSGMMGGITSPARPWFRLSIADPNFNEIDSVKQWLHLVSSRMLSVFGDSNLYKVLPIVYGDMGDFGTAAMLLEEDFEKVFRAYSIPIGSYTLACSNTGRVDIFQREFKMTARQIVQKFGMKPGSKEIDWSNISSAVKNAYGNNSRETWFNIVHFVLPNEDYDHTKKLSKFKRYSSIYYERGTNGSKNTAAYTDEENARVLSEKGYDYFPVLAPRWEVTGEDTYGTACPGMDALGDIKQLQFGVKKLANSIDISQRPPMKGPPSLMGQKSSILPGDMTYVDEQGGRATFAPAFQIDPRVRELKELNNDIRMAISRTYYEDLFLMLAQMDERRDPTAREIEAREQEKLLALGPVLEQLNEDLLDPLIDIVFNFMVRQGLIPEPPEEIAGRPLKVEYVSIMAQAQKLAGIGNLERLMNTVMAIGPVNASIWNKVDINEWMDRYGENLSVPPGVLRSDEQVLALEQAQAQQQAQQARAEQLNLASQSARNFSQTDMEADSAFTRMTNAAEAGQLVAV